MLFKFTLNLNIFKLKVEMHSIHSLSVADITREKFSKQSLNRPHL